MEQTGIATIRALLASKPRPVGWAARRQRLDEIGSVWPVAADVTLAPVDVNGIAGEWSTVPGSDSSRVLLFLHGGGSFRSPPRGDHKIRDDERMVYCLFSQGSGAYRFIAV